VADHMIAKRVILQGIFEPAGLMVPDKFMADGERQLERAGLDKVRSAVTKWRNEQKDRAPEYWSEFKPFLATARGPRADKADAQSPAWWGRDGSWGGDWTTAVGWTMVIPAATMQCFANRWHRESADAFQRLAIENGARPEHIKACFYMIKACADPHNALVQRWMSDETGKELESVLGKYGPKVEGNVTG